MQPHHEPFPQHGTMNLHTNICSNLIVTFQYNKPRCNDTLKPHRNDVKFRYMFQGKKLDTLWNNIKFPTLHGLSLCDSPM